MTVASLSRSPSHLLSPSFPPATVSPQKIQRSPGTVSASSCNETPATSVIQLCRNQDSALLTVNEHRTEAQSAGRNLKAKQTCIKAVTAAQRFLPRESAKLKCKKDGLKKLNEELIREEFSASQIRNRKKLDKIFSSLAFSMVGVAIKVDLSVHLRL